MNSKQEDKFGMFLKTDQILVVHALILAFNPAIATARTVLNTFINAIAQADSTTTRDITGYTQAKNDHKNAQSALFKIVRAGLMAHFTTNLDVAIREVINFSDTEIDYFRDAELYMRTDQLLDVALPVKNSLATSGVTATQVEDLDTMNQAWYAIEPSSRIQEGVNKAAGEMVDVIFVQTDNHIKNTIDNLMKVMQYNNANIYSQYLTARMIDDSGGSSGSDGYEVSNLTVPAGGSILLPVFSSGGGIPADLDVYLRAINGNVTVCTTNLPANPCSSGFALQQGATYKGLFSGLSLDMSNSAIQFTNNSVNNVIVRAGTKN